MLLSCPRGPASEVFFFSCAHGDFTGGKPLPVQVESYSYGRKSLHFENIHSKDEGFSPLADLFDFALS